MEQHPVDNRVDMELDLENELLFELMLEAHRQDITLNQFIEHILQTVIEEKKLEQIQRQSNPVSP